MGKTTFWWGDRILMEKDHILDGGDRILMEHDHILDGGRETAS